MFFYALEMKNNVRTCKKYNPIVGIWIWKHLQTTIFRELNSNVLGIYVAWVYITDKIKIKRFHCTCRKEPYILKQGTN